MRARAGAGEDPVVGDVDVSSRDYEAGRSDESGAREDGSRAVGTKPNQGAGGLLVEQSSGGNLKHKQVVSVEGEVGDIRESRGVEGELVASADSPDPCGAGSEGLPGQLPHVERTVGSNGHGGRDRLNDDGRISGRKLDDLGRKNREHRNLSLGADPQQVVASCIDHREAASVGGERIRVAIDRGVPEPRSGASASIGVPSSLKGGQVRDHPRDCFAGWSRDQVASRGTIATKTVCALRVDEGVLLQDVVAVVTHEDIGGPFGPLPGRACCRYESGYNSPLRAICYPRNRAAQPDTGLSRAGSETLVVSSNSGLDDVDLAFAPDKELPRVIQVRRDSCQSWVAGSPGLRNARYSHRRGCRHRTGERDANERAPPSSETTAASPSYCRHPSY